MSEPSGAAAAGTQPELRNNENDAPGGELGGFTVYESGTPVGTDPGNGKEVHVGAFYIHAADGVRDLSISNIPIISDGIFRKAELDILEGRLSFTGYDAATGRLDYIYRGLSGAAHHSPDDLISRIEEVRLIDRDGDVTTGLFRINFVDDVLIGVDDAYRLDPGQSLYNNRANLLLNDHGADGRTVYGIEGDLTDPANNSLTGEHGSVTIGFGGQVTYIPKAGDRGGVDEFRVLISDDDGDKSTSLLSFQVGPQTPTGDRITRVNLEAEGPGASEQNGTASSSRLSYFITRTGDLSAPATVTWSVTGAGSNPATGDDFKGGVLPSGTVSFAPGEGMAILSFNVADDTQAEANETFQITMTSATGAVMGPGVSRVGTILDRNGVGPRRPPRAGAG
jgi:hypothetical protein